MVKTPERILPRKPLHPLEHPRQTSLARTSKPVGRLAPSPTGGLHLGNARTFLLAWLIARRDHGQVVFRMEDLDLTRARDDAARQALEDLKWLGLNWDEGPDVGGPNGPYVQSQRSHIYQSALDRLIDANLVYPCTCTRADVLRAASAPHADDAQPIYPGTCSHRHASEGFTLDQLGKSFAWRFRAAGLLVDWTDRVRGPQSHALDRIGGDFIVARSGGVFGYQLAVVVDDAAMNITQVVRGHDLDDSTPRQLLIQEALGLPRPEYWHVGLVLGPEGKRLAKRDQAIKLSELRVSGVLPGQILAMLGRSLGLKWVETDRLPSPMDFLNFDWPEGDVNCADDWTWSSHRLHEV